MSDKPKIYYIPPLLVLTIVIFFIGRYFVINAETFIHWLKVPTWLIFVPLVILIVIPLFFGFKLLTKEVAKADYDMIRLSHLNLMKEGFQRYYGVNEFYPKSNLGGDYNNKWVRIPNDWNFLQFPSHEEMWKYIHGWPLLDPTFDTKNPGKSKFYLYRITPDGKNFALYTQLDNISKQKLPDYNLIDKIDEQVGHYNYKITSQQQQQPPNLN